MLSSKISVILDGKARTFFLDALLLRIGVKMPVVTVSHRGLPIVGKVPVQSGRSLAEVERDIIGRTIEMIDSIKRTSVQKVTEAKKHEEVQLREAYLRLFQLADPAIDHLMSLGKVLTVELARGGSNSSVKFTTEQEMDLGRKLDAVLAKTNQDKEEEVLVS